MEDEYGTMTSDGLTHEIPSFTLECGTVLHGLQVRYRVWGHLNPERDNVLVVCHALTGNADLESWWGELLGPGKPFDTDKYLVFCANILGSCYGTTGPSSVNPDTGKVYGIGFPAVTVRDTVAAHRAAVQHGLGAKSVKCVIGGSLGGMQALEWAMMPDYVHAVLPMACGAYHHAWQIAMSELQRQALYMDPKWNDGILDTQHPPKCGLALARMIAMVSYRTPHAFNLKFGRKTHDGLMATADTATIPTAAREGPGYAYYEAKRYLEYQGIKFLSRMDAWSYKAITEQMDSHDLGRGRGGIQSALASIRMPVHVIGISSDVLYPVAEQEEIVKHIPHSTYKVIESPEGHDGFLLEQKAISTEIKTFLAALDKPKARL